MSQGIEGVLSIMLSAFFGGLASVGQLLSSAKILTPRRIVASMIAGVSSGIVAGAIFGATLPELSENYLLVSGAGSVGGVFGVNAAVFFFMRRYAPEILKNDDNIDSVTVKSLIDSGEFTKDEIDELINMARRKRAKVSERLDDDTT
jgi:purine-cytosine permease-like protein